MSEVNEIAREQTAQKNAQGWTLTRVWLVQLDSHLWGPYSAIQAVTADPDGADIGDAHPINPFVFLRRFPQPTGEENRKIWRVTGEYEQGVLPGWPGNPLQAPSTIAWSSATYTDPAVDDIDGNAIVNSAGQAFDPPLTIERRALVATIGYNSEDFDVTQASEFQNTVNATATVIGNFNVGARQAKIIEIGAVQQYYKDIAYWAVTIKVEINPETWDRLVLDQGIYQKDPNDATKIVRMATDDQAEATEPLKLDGNGAKLDPQSADPEFLTYKTFPETNFAVLDLEV